MLVSLDVGSEDQTLAHGVLSVLGDVHGSLDGVPKLQLVGFHGNNLQERHLLDQLLGPLVVKAVLLSVVTGSFKVDTTDVTTELQLLLDGIGVLLLGDDGITDTLIKRPSLGATGCLSQSSQVGLRSGETTEPHDLGLFNFIPILVLLVSGEEVLQPGDQSLKSLGSLGHPTGRHETIEQTVGQCFQSFTHSNNSTQSLLQVRQSSSHRVQEDVEAIQFLEQHHLSGTRHLKLLLDIVSVKKLRKFGLDIGSDTGDVLFSALASSFSSSIRSLHL